MPWAYYKTGGGSVIPVCFTAIVAPRKLMNTKLKWNVKNLSKCILVVRWKSLAAPPLFPLPLHPTTPSLFSPPLPFVQFLSPRTRLFPLTRLSSSPLPSLHSYPPLLLSLHASLLPPCFSFSLSLSLRFFLSLSLLVLQACRFLFTSSSSPLTPRLSPSNSATKRIPYLINLK